MIKTMCSSVKYDKRCYRKASISKLRYTFFLDFSRRVSNPPEKWRGMQKSEEYCRSPQALDDMGGRVRVYLRIQGVLFVDQ